MSKMAVYRAGGKKEKNPKTIYLCTGRREKKPFAWRRTEGKAPDEAKNLRGGQGITRTVHTRNEHLRKEPKAEKKSKPGRAVKDGPRIFGHNKTQSLNQPPRKGKGGPWGVGGKEKSNTAKEGGTCPGGGKM